MIRGIRRVIQHNGRVQRGERVVVVTNPEMRPIADLLVAELAAHGADARQYVVPTRTHDGQEPPADAVAAMLEANVIFSPVSVSITHTRAMRAALARGARAILMTAHNERVLTCPALLETDFNEQAHVGRAIGAAFQAGKVVHLTSEKGTDLRIPIAGRPVNILTGVPGPGELAPVPTIETNVVPVHGASEGILVADGSIPYIGIGVLTEPVVCTVERGYIVKFEGGTQAQRVEAALRAHGNRECFNVAELGVGLNPNATLSGFMLEDEGVMGSIHIGIGTSFTLGGEIVAPTHYDLVMLRAKLVVDGRVVMENCQVKV